MLDTIDVSFDGKCHSNFDLKRAPKVAPQDSKKPVTAYLCGASMGAIQITTVKLSTDGSATPFNANIWHD